jgi:hypothetical protein
MFRVDLPDSGIQGPGGSGYGGTSATSLATAGSGSKAFTTQAGLAYSKGARIRASSIGTGEYMEGVVASYSGTTLTVTMYRNVGTGTHADWTINLAGDVGAAGSPGSPGSGATITGLAGQIPICDGAGNAAGSADLTFDTGSKTLTVGAFGFADLGGGILQLGDSNLTWDAANQRLIFGSGGSWDGLTLKSQNIQGLDGGDLSIRSNATANATISLANAGAWGINNTAIGWVGNVDGSGTFSFGTGAAFSWNFNTDGTVGGNFDFASSLLVAAGGGNTIDLGSVTDPWRTGYFGTSVVAPRVDIGADFVLREVSSLLELGSSNATVDGSGNFHGKAFLTASAQAAFVAAPYGVSAGQTGEFRCLELAANGTNYVALKAPDALAGSLAFTLPATDAAGPLASNGAGVLSAVAGADLTIVIPVANKTLTFTKGVLTAVV